MAEQGPETATGDDTAPESPYEPPTITSLGQVRDVVLGTGSHDTADMNTSRYW